MSSDEEDEYDNVDDLENALELFHNETIKIVHDEGEDLLALLQ